MCGFVGCLDLYQRRPVDEPAIRSMTAALTHRGPDAEGVLIDAGFGVGFRRLAIVDIAGGDQPLTNEDGSLVLVCNGEIFNDRELGERWLGGRHRLKTRSDCEVILHLYEELGDRLLDHLNGQFAFALYDREARRLLLARDPVGIAPLFYTVVDGYLIFGSEIKAILRHPKVRAELDPVGLDQVLCFPGLVSPRTMFAGIRALPPGCALVCAAGAPVVKRYWDLDYPVGAIEPARDVDAYVDELAACFEGAVRRRLRADVPVGVYLSGGLDSSLVAAMMRRLQPDAALRSFAVAFDDPAVSEQRYQRLMADTLRTEHHEIRFDDDEIQRRFTQMIYHAECPVKETYNTCVLALAETTRAAGVKVVLGGEGADELFAGYPGYRFDAFAALSEGGARAPDAELRCRERLWGDATVGYERRYAEFAERRAALYSDALLDRFETDGDALSTQLAEPARLRGRHPVHQRSYLDMKLRLADHLLGDHGDHMLMAHSVEGRYPFLDRELIECARRMPPDLKLRDFEEKYVLKRMAERWVPDAIVRREKFGFHAAASPALLRSGAAWVDALLSPERIRRDGYFRVDTVEALKARCRARDAALDPRHDDDMLLVVLSFNVLLDTFFS